MSRWKSFLVGIFTSLLGCASLMAQPCKPTVNLGSSISFCSGNSIQLNAFNPSSTYLWSTGATTASINVSSTGLYWVQVTNSCGTTSDSVQIYASTPLNISLGPDRNVCSSNTTTLSTPFQSGTSYQWNTGSTSNSINVSQSGAYHLTATNACGTYTDTVNITVQNPASANLGPDIFECNDSTVTLYSGNSSGNRTWSTGATTDSITVSTSGNYWLRISNACGTVRDTVAVNFLGDFNLFSADTIAICTGSSYNLSTTVAGTYQWSTGATSQSISVSTPGTYWLQIQAPCGTLHDTVVFEYVPEPTVNLGPDTTICDNTSLSLSSAPFPGSYLWSTGSNNQSINVSNAGTYWLRIDNGCRYFYDTIQVDVTPIPQNIFADTIKFCPGTAQKVDPGNYGPGTQYTWSNGATSQVQFLNTAGDYWVYVSNSCGADTFSFHLKADANRAISLGPDTITTCQSSIPLNLTGAFASDSIVWSTGAQQSMSINVSSTGTYTVHVYNNCGVFTDSVYLSRIRPPSGISADTIDMCATTTAISIGVANRAFTSYLWSNGDTNRSTSVSTAGSYSIIVSNLCDTLYDTVYVRSVSPLSVNLGPDQTICAGNSTTINASALASQADSIRWSDGSNTPNRTFTTGGTFVLRAYNICGVFTDTIQITRINLPLKKLNDTAFCSGSSVTLNAAQSQVNSYSWNNGASTSSITVSTPGWYYVVMNNQCGSVTDSAFVGINSPLGTVDLGQDTIFCAGSLTLDAGLHSGASYLWQDGSTGRYFSASQSGTYYVRVQNGCGTKFDTINILITGPPQLVLGNFVAYCSTNTLTLNAQNPGSSYLWNTGATTQTITVTTPGLYWVTITNNCGTASDTVQAIVESPPLNYNLGQDTTICSGDTLRLQTGYPQMSTLWQDGSRDNRFEVTQTGTYYATITNSCGSFYDTINVTVRNQSPTFSLGPDTSFCLPTTTLTLSGPPNMSQYLWNNGSTAQTITVNTPGNYSLTTTDFCGYTFTDSIFVDGHLPLNIDLGRDTTLCPGDFITLNSGVTKHPVIWEDGRTGSTRLVGKAGEYIASSSNSCGTFSDTVLVFYREEPEFSNTNVEMCEDDSLVVNVNEILNAPGFDFTGFDTYWSDGDRSRQKVLDSAGSYILYFENQCQSYPKFYNIRTQLCDCPVFVPSAFSPNGDGLNESFDIGGACEFTDYHLRIFSRWGQLIFESTDPENNWDGTFNGSPQEVGVYSYFLSYQWTELEETHSREKSGTVTLIR